MIKFFVKRPVTTVMFVLMWVVLGIVTYPKMNIESTPAVDFPMVTASFIYPGASPDEIESQVLKRSEDIISEVAEVKKIQSQAFENGGYVMAEFNLGVNVNDKVSEVKAKIESIMGDYPDDLKQPVVEKLNPLEESVVDIALSGADIRELEYYSNNFLSARITSIPGVASVAVYGGEERAIRVYLNPEQMASYGMSINDVVRAIAMHNLNVPGGKIETKDNSNIVRFIGEFASVDDVSSLELTTVEGAILQLKDIARIEDSALDKETGARYNGENIVVASVIKSSDGNSVEISKQLQKRLPGMEKALSDYFANPSNFNNEESVSMNTSMKIISDSSISITDETNNTVKSIVLGLILTVLILLFFTRDWRTTVIAGVVIPATLISGLFFMDLSGFTINTITLIAIATALGTLITDAIILIESALSLIREGWDPEDAAVEGTKRVMVRIFATIATHIVVFLPLAFMDGIAGQFMKQFGLTVIYLTLISSMFSFTLTPMMIGKILKKQTPDQVKAHKKAKAGKEELAWFRKFYDWQVEKPWSAVGIAMLVLVLSVFPMRWMGNEFASMGDMDEITVTARAGSSATYSKLEEVAIDIEKRLGDFKDIKSVSIKIASTNNNTVNAKVELVPRKTRKKTDKEISRDIVPVLSDIPGVDILVRAGKGISEAISSDLVININGEDNEKREAYAARVINMLNEMPQVQSAVLEAQNPGQEIKFIPNNKNMKFWGVQNQTAGSTLRTALFGNDTYKYKENGDEYPILIELAPEYKNNEMFSSVFVATNKGLVPLSDLGKVETAAATANIRRIDKLRITEINVNLGKSTIGPVQEKIEKEFANMDWDNGYYAEFGGMSEMQEESTGEIGSAFLLATILTFMVLAAILNSLAHPFTIVTGILTSFSGVFILMFLVGASINIGAMLSLVMLVGLAVSTNILLLEPTIVDVQKGVPPKEALWTHFVDKKRMLIMSTVAVVAGLVPQLWASEGIKVSMGAVIIGGILASLFWTFFVTPALFTIMERFRSLKNKE